MKVVKPLNLIPYTKADAINLLKERFDWQPYANKHFESVFTRFYEGYWLVKKFGYDKRRAHFSSLVLTGQMTRDQALKKLSEPPYEESLAMEDMEYVAKKLGLTKESFIDLMNGENKTFRDYKSSYFLIKTAIDLARLFGLENRQFK